MLMPQTTTRQERENADGVSRKVQQAELPQIIVHTNRPTIREIFVLGWQYFLPNLGRRQ
jgi:hypothetical protein